MNKFIWHILSLLALGYASTDVHAQVITEVSSLEFYENHMQLLEEETTVLIDGRSKEMFEEGHIAGAVFIDAFQDGFLPGLSSYAGKSVIVVYCTNRRRSTVLIDALKTFYTGHIVCICDGITGWKQNNLPVAPF
jgi:rhodanese-related sulfurtransferase